jgi:hypothetical protein
MMLASYYSKNADFKNLFDKCEISRSLSYLKHLNNHNVIYINFSSPITKTKSYDSYIGGFTSKLMEDIREEFPQHKINGRYLINEIFDDVYNKIDEKFIFIIDEWDYIFNNNLFTLKDRNGFLEFLKNLLKDKPYVELAYMTGVLPIAKYSSGSALNMFREYNMLNDKKYDKYFGFTISETKNLCNKQNKISLDELKDWYNGYKTCSGIDILNPRSVVCALNDGDCQSYWTSTGPMDEISYYIKNNIEAVRDDIVRMVSDLPVKVLLEGYGAERISLNTREEILSAMTVYGFLSYYNKVLSIPNKELKMKFNYSLRNSQMGGISKLILRSDQM